MREGSQGHRGPRGHFGGRGTPGVSLEVPLGAGTVHGDTVCSHRSQTAHSCLLWPPSPGSEGHQPLSLAVPLLKLCPSSSSAPSAPPGAVPSLCPQGGQHQAGWDTFPNVLPAPLVSPSLGQCSLSWAGNPLLPPSFPQSQPGLEGEGRGIFSTHPPVVPRIELKRGIDVQRRAGFALKGRVCAFPTTQSLQNFPVKRDW